MAPTLERKLRVGSLICCVGAATLLIPASVESVKVGPWWAGNAVLPFSFIPLAFTILTSTFYVFLQRQAKDEERAQWSPQLLWLAADALIFSGYIIALVFEWVQGLPRLTRSPGNAFLEAYATVPLMANMLVHLVAFFVNLWKNFLVPMSKGLKKSNQCPHCHHQIGAKHKEAVQKGSGEGYSLLRGEDYDEDAARASEDNAAIGPVLDV